MSATFSYIIPEPVRLDPFRAGEVEERAIDFTNDLLPYGDTIASVVAIAVVGRDNGATLGDGDLAIITNDPQRPIAFTGTMVGWWQTSSDAVCSSGATIDYHLVVSATTQAGRTIFCDALQLVVPSRG